ncbi:hypothetical protein EYF80_020760 [Liparis tanakae]|uniref:Uncharacterized protein n=1 Tax=Liparis tanakae TaxID=230148 RepID=A0A4Z2HTQ0_9TELE|nr:hypothetical protein EYF80_020760 [Liparis tanakae]
MVKRSCYVSKAKAAVVRWLCPVIDCVCSRRSHTRTEPLITPGAMDDPRTEMQLGPHTVSSVSRATQWPSVSAAAFEPLALPPEPRSHTLLGYLFSPARVMLRRNPGGLIVSHKSEGILPGPSLSPLTLAPAGRGRLLESRAASQSPMLALSAAQPAPSHGFGPNPFKRLDRDGGSDQLRRALPANAATATAHGRSVSPHCWDTPSPPQKGLEEHLVLLFSQVLARGVKPECSADKYSGKSGHYT